jgi:hypothetical protein
MPTEHAEGGPSDRDIPWRRQDENSCSPHTYHPDYYGAFVLDPDGHNLEAVCHRRP